MVSAVTLRNEVNHTAHKSSPMLGHLMKDLGTFLTKNPACQCTIVALNVNAAGKKNVFMIRGKLSINLAEAQKQKQLGFRFILPTDYPKNVPLVYLDEPENKEVIEMIDYLEAGNRIMFNYLFQWDKAG